MYILSMRSVIDPKLTWPQLVSADVVTFALECWSHGDAVIEKIEEVTATKDVTNSFSDQIDHAIAELLTKSEAL